MTKPTFASVTDEACKCNYLQRMADDPNSPVFFDPEMNEYNFERLGATRDSAAKGSAGSFKIYHCPFCGGAGPASKRELMFTVISDAEQRRIFTLLNGIETIEEAIRVLGIPDQDCPHGSGTMHPEKNGEPPTVERFRTLTYLHLSETAEVCILQNQYGKVHVTLRGKYIGPPKT